MTIPSLTCNFLQIPEAFCDLLLSQNLTRNEILVLVSLAKQTFGLVSMRGLVPIEDIIKATKLAPDAVQEAIARSIDRDLIIKFDVMGSSGAPVLYALNTQENALLAGYEAAPAKPPAPPPPALHPPGSAQAADKTIPPSASVQEQIQWLIGRPMTKDETARLSSLKAPDADLIEAVRNLEDRKIKLYSSDQVVYEVETLQMKRRQEQEHQAAVRSKRGPTCTVCGGTGYLFVGNKSIKVCDCRR